MTIQEDDQSTFRGEDVNTDFASPVMDLTACGVLAAVAIWMMVESWRLPVPGGLLTAPGLLPFVSAAGLLAMTAVLVSMALKRKSIVGLGSFEVPEDIWRSAGLGLIMIVYVAALQYLPVSWTGNVVGTRVSIGSFEVASLVVITAVLRLFWKRPVWMCFAVTLVWIAFLSIVFRLVFSIPLP